MYLRVQINLLPIKSSAQKWYDSIPWFIKKKHNHIFQNYSNVSLKIFFNLGSLNLWRYSRYEENKYTRNFKAFHFFHNHSKNCYGMCTLDKKSWT